MLCTWAFKNHYFFTALPFKMVECSECIAPMPFQISNQFPSSESANDDKFRFSNRLQVPIFKPITATDFQTDFQNPKNHYNEVKQSQQKYKQKSHSKNTNSAE